MTSLNHLKSQRNLATRHLNRSQTIFQTPSHLLSRRAKSTHTPRTPIISDNVSIDTKSAFKPPSLQPISTRSITTTAPKEALDASVLIPLLFVLNFVRLQGMMLTHAFPSKHTHTHILITFRQPQPAPAFQSFPPEIPIQTPSSSTTDEVDGEVLDSSFIGMSGGQVSLLAFPKRSLLSRVTNLHSGFYPQTEKPVDLS